MAKLIRKYMIKYRVFNKNLKRIRNRLSSYVNRLRLYLYGVDLGRNCVIHGKLYIKLFPSAKVSIGDDFYCSSGWNVNALCTNRRGAFYATENAEIRIGNNVGMSSPVLWAHKGVIIGDNVKIGANSILIDTDSHSLDYRMRRSPSTDGGKTMPIVVEDDVLIGANCIILKGVRIGARSVVGAGSVVTRDVPPDTVVAGNPAVVIKKLDFR